MKPFILFSTIFSVSFLFACPQSHSTGCSETVQVWNGVRYKAIKRLKNTPECNQRRKRVQKVIPRTPKEGKRTGHDEVASEIKKLKKKDTYKLRSTETPKLNRDRSDSINNLENERKCFYPKIMKKTSQIKFPPNKMHCKMINIQVPRSDIA